MWPGVANCKTLDKFKKDEVVLIKSAKGEGIAIGAMGCNYEEMM